METERKKRGRVKDSAQWAQRMLKSIRAGASREKEVVRGKGQRLSWQTSKSQA